MDVPNVFSDPDLTTEKLRLGELNVVHFRLRVEWVRNYLEVDTIRQARDQTRVRHLWVEVYFHSVVNQRHRVT